MSASPSKRWPRVRRVLGYILLVFLGLSLFLIAAGWTAFGKGAQGERLARMEASPQWNGSGFDNPLPLWNDFWGSTFGAPKSSEVASPGVPVPTVQPDPKVLAELPTSGLRATWLGHSTVLIEIDGKRFLTDPVWGERTSPFTFVGPQRWYAPPIALADLPAIDAVLISHDHYDHLDAPTIKQISQWDTKFVTPLGVGAHLEYWGVPAERIIEVDWWDTVQLGDVQLVCSPARHASGRHLLDQNDTLWAGYALIGNKHRVFFSGDTGLFPGFADIGEKYGPFDLTMIEVGAYHQAWPDWHIGPEQALIAHQMLRGKAMLPIHWGLFDLAMHGWTEPIERTMVAAEKVGAKVFTPKPGQSVEPAATVTERWWPEVSWQTAAEHPIRSTGIASDNK